LGHLSVCFFAFFGPRWGAFGSSCMGQGAVAKPKCTTKNKNSRNAQAAQVATANAPVSAIPPERCDEPLHAQASLPHALGSGCWEFSVIAFGSPPMIGSLTYWDLSVGRFGCLLDGSLGWCGGSFWVVLPLVGVTLGRLGIPLGALGPAWGSFEIFRGCGGSLRAALGHIAKKMRSRIYCRPAIL
jgi:hypothetical protein